MNTDLLVDTAVTVKWFHSDGETEVAEARSLVFGQAAGAVSLYVLDLATYELGNVLLRRLKWDVDAIVVQLADLMEMCGTPIPWHQEWSERAVRYADRFKLSFYDAAWAAAATELGMNLVSADEALLKSGLAESATSAADRLGLLQ